MRLRLAVLILLLWCVPALAQNGPTGNIPANTYQTLPSSSPQSHGTGVPTATCSSGNLYTNDSNGVLYTCNAGTWQTAGAGAAPGQNSVTQAINVADSKYGAKFNGKAFFSNTNTCSFSSGAATFSCTGANLTSADVGKQFTATVGGCCGVANSYLGTLAFTNAATTIISVQSSTQGTISQNFTSNSGSNWIIAWATNDDAALSSAETDWAAANKCGAIILPAGITAVLQPHFVSPGTNCLGMEPQADYTASVSGQGIGSTIIGLFPGFNFTGAGGCSTQTNTQCFGGYKESYFQNFQFNGFGWGNTGAGSAVNLLVAALGSQWSQIACNAFGGSDANLTGIRLDTGARMWGLSIDGCGKIGESINGSIVKTYYQFVGDTLGANVNILGTGDLTDYGGDYGGTGGTQIIAFGGNNARYNGVGSNLFSCGATNSTAIFIGAVTGSTVILNGARFNCPSTTSNGIFSSAASNTIYLTGGTIVGGTSAGINLTAGTVYSSGSTITSATAAIAGSSPTNAKFIDQCGNSFTGTITAAANLLFTPCPTATYGTAVPFVGATGTGACATITTQNGNLFNGSLKCTGTTGASTIVLNPGITAQNGWNCRGSQDVTTPANTFTQNTISSASCTLIFGTVTQNDVVEFNLAQF